LKSTFVGGSKDGHVEYFPYTNRLEVQIVRYIGPDQNPDGTWPEGADSDDWYVPAELEVYSPTITGRNQVTYTFQGSR